MVTKRTPTIDSGGKLLEKFIPDRLADTALNATYAPRASAPFTINSTDASGNPTSITYHLTGGDLVTTYTYGVNGIATETTGGQTITYTYDAAGNMTGAA